MSDRGSIVNADTIQFERTLPGPMERVWEYLTLPALTAIWLAPSDIQARVGGNIQLRFEIAEAPGQIRPGAKIQGVVSRCAPPYALSHSWIDLTNKTLVAGESTVGAVASQVSYELRAEGEQILLTMRHQGLSVATIPNFGAGWHAHLDTLRARLTGEEPRPFLEAYRRLLPWYVQLARLQPSAPAGRKGGATIGVTRIRR